MKLKCGGSPLMLVKTAGWTPSDYESWLNRTLTTLVLGEDASP